MGETAQLRELTLREVVILSIFFDDFAELHCVLPCLKFFTTLLYIKGD